MAVVQFLQQVLAVGGTSAVILYGLFTFVGKKWFDKWVDNRFASRLEKLKHEQQKEVEHLRHQIQSMFSRVSKIHAKEFEVLPKAWLMLHETYGWALQLTAMFMTVPDFNAISDAGFEEFLTQTILSPAAQQELRDKKDPSERDKYYTKAVAMARYDKAIESHRKLRNYIIENQIFMTPELSKQFHSAADDLINGVNSFHIGKNAGDHALEREGYETVKGLEPKVSAIADAVQKRLRYEEA